MGANQHTSKGRTVQYRIMFTTDEKRALDARAAAEGVTLADLIRAALGLADAPCAEATHWFQHGQRESCERCGRPFTASVHRK